MIPSGRLLWRAGRALWEAAGPGSGALAVTLLYGGAMSLGHPPSSAPATGAQFDLVSGDTRAVIAALGAGLRLFASGGVALTETYEDHQTAPGATGLTLAPWANRVRDGQWTYQGKAQQLDITEVSRHNASHGLLRNTAYHVLNQTADSVRLEAAIHPQHGYPFLLRHQVRYSVTPGALAVEQRLINDGVESAPVALGAHPYLRIGDIPTENLTVTVAADERLVADEQLIPVGREAVSGDYDLRSGALAGERDLDIAYTSLKRDDDGLARARLSAADGRAVSLWQDAAATYLHVYVTREFPGQHTAVALEPMTAPADAFNSGDGLHWLEPGESFTMTWGIDAELG